MLMMAKTAALLMPSGGAADYPIVNMFTGQNGGTIGWIEGFIGTASPLNLMPGFVLSYAYTSGGVLHIGWSESGTNWSALSAALAGKQFALNGTPYAMSIDTDNSSYLDWYRSTPPTLSPFTNYTMQIV